MLELKGELGVQDRRLPSGGRCHRPQPDRRGRRPTGRGPRRGSRAWARPSTRRSPSWRLPARCASTSGSAAEVPPSLVDAACGPRPRARRPATCPRRTWASRRSTTSRAAAERAVCARSAGMSASTEALVLEGIGRLEDRLDRMRLAHGGGTLTGAASAGCSRRRPGVRSIEPAGSYRRRREIVGDLDLLVETDQPAEAHRHVHPVRAGSISVLNRGGYKAAVQLMRGPQVGSDVDAARRGRHVPDPLHRVQGAQRAAPRASPRPRLEPLGEGFPAHRRERRAADRGGGGASHIRVRDGGVCVPRAALHRARAARGRRRDRGGARGPAADAHREARPAGRPAQPLGLVGRSPADRGHGRARAAARLRLPGADRSHASRSRSHAA